MHNETGDGASKTAKITQEDENVDLTNDHTNSKEKKCKFCPSMFETIKEYLSHIETIHQNKNRNYFMCSVCGKQYKTKSELTHHINSKCGTVKKFNCKICNQDLMSAGSLYNHMLRHNGERSFMCGFCAKLFFTAGQLKVHERIHTQDKAYVCEICNKGFCHRQSLITHSTLHTGIKPYQCENCGNSFSCVGNLMKHRTTHADTCGLIPLTTHRVKHPSTKIKVKINTPSNSRLKMREKDIELEKELNLLKTELCKDKTDIDQGATILEINKQDISLNSISSINDHEDISNIEHISNSYLNKNVEHIDTCDAAGTIKLQSLSQHDIRVGKEENHFDEPFVSHEDSSSDENNLKINGDEKNQQTEEIGKNGIKRSCKKKSFKKDLQYETVLTEFMEEINFEAEGYGDYHENNIPRGAENKSGVPLYKCSCCKMSFFTKEESLAHQQSTHADILTCQECEKMFANRDSLRSHQKVFHKGLGRKAYIYICDKCGKQFKQKSYLKCHEERNCDKGPFFECSVCQKQFSSRHTRNNHMRVHDSEKKLLCKFCAKSFHWKGQLKIHERSHTGEKPFACLYCPKAFAYRESLITHSTIHTGIKPHLCEGCGSRFSCIGNLIKHRSSHANECGAWIYKTQKPSQDTSNN
jgi:KRAB domain-containing zinc finger protein